MDNLEKEFETVVREHRSTIYTVCYMFSDDADEVADLFQETLINMWKGFARFRWRERCEDMDMARCTQYVYNCRA